MEAGKRRKSMRGGKGEETEGREREMRVHGSGDGGWKEKKEHEGGKGEETEGGRERDEGAWEWRWRHRKEKKEHEGGKGEETEGEREMRVHGSGDGA